MAEGEKPKWQKEIEAMVVEQFQPEQVPELVKELSDLIDRSQGLEPPSGDLGKVIAGILKQASEELGPLPSVYTGFQLGVAWERHQNANRARKETATGQIFEEVAKIVGWSEREKRFLATHFGQQSFLTYEQLGAEFGITRERARQIIRKALLKMFRD